MQNLRAAAHSAEANLTGYNPKSLDPDLPTPRIVIDANRVRRNIERMSAYARSRGLGLRPHTKTHKSIMLARMQLGAGAVGLTVAKPGEAAVMAEVGDDILMAYPCVHEEGCRLLAEMARTKTVRVALDSAFAAPPINAKRPSKSCATSQV